MSVGNVVWRRYVYPLFFDPSAANDANSAEVEDGCFGITNRNLRVECKGDFVGRSVVIHFRRPHDNSLFCLRLIYFTPQIISLRQISLLSYVFPTSGLFSWVFPS
jgi:hypothetical protein